MNTSLRHHFKRVGGRPKKALTREEAAAAATLHRKHAYRCDFCGAWHIGGPTRPRRKQVSS